MSWSNYLTLGVKLIGVWCLIIAMRELFWIVPYNVRQLSRLGQSPGVFAIPGLFSFAIPPAMAAFGYYLIRDGTYFHELGSSQLAESSAAARGWFVLGTLLCGLYFVVSSIPTALRLLFYLVAVLQAPAYVSTTESMAWIARNAPATCGTVTLGWIFIIRANRLFEIVSRGSKF